VRMFPNLPVPGIRVNPFYVQLRATMTITVAWLRNTHRSRCPLRALQCTTVP
jgi:hypothetical protein